MIIPRPQYLWSENTIVSTICYSHLSILPCPRWSPCCWISGVLRSVRGRKCSYLKQRGWNRLRARQLGPKVQAQFSCEIRWSREGANISVDNVMVEIEWIGLVAGQFLSTELNTGRSDRRERLGPSIIGSAECHDLQLLSEVFRLTTALER